MLDRASLLGPGLAAGDETRLGEDCEFRFAVFCLTTARARRSWSRSFLRAFEELREIAGGHVSQVQEVPNLTKSSYSQQEIWSVVVLYFQALQCSHWHSRSFVFPRHPAGCCLVAIRHLLLLAGRTLPYPIWALVPADFAPL